MIKIYGITEKILKLGRGNDYFSAKVEGNLGVGKSSLCIKIAYQYFKAYHYTDKEAWKLALGCVKFKIEDIIEVYETHNYNNRKEILIIDDASVHLSSSRWFTDRNLVSKLEALLTTGRTSVQVLLINCPQVSRLIPFLRDERDYRVEIKHSNEGGNAYARLAITRTSFLYYGKSGLGSTRYKIEPSLSNEFSCKLPNWVFKLYMEERDTYKNELLTHLKDIDTIQSKKYLEEII